MEEGTFGKSGKFGRDFMTEDDVKIIDETKEMLTIAIEKLKEGGLRYTNIQIALESHIKKNLKDD